MEFAWSPQQQALYSEVVEFARRELTDDVVDRDHASVFDQTLWQRAADFGVLRWAVAQGHGGAGYPVTTVAYLMEALGYGCADNGLTFGLGAQMWGMQTALVQFGSAQQHEAYLAPLLLGKAITALAVNEPGSGSDAFNLETTAVRDGEHYILTGEKSLITLAPVADFAIVFAMTNPSAGRWGISAFLVEANCAGFKVSPEPQWMGLRTVPVGRITLDHCRVPCTQRLGAEGAGASIFTYAQGWERSLILAPQLGVMQRLLEQCVEVARSRKRANSPIGKHQAVSHRVANIKLRLETARLLLYKTAWLQQDNKPNLMEAALAKIYLSECFRESCLESIAIHGGSGYQTDTGLERNLRDAIGGTIYGGTLDVQRNIVAGLLGL